MILKREKRFRPQFSTKDTPMSLQLTGIHHLTAIAADAPGNVRFYTDLLGLRLIKKTVNQDDVTAYHLFYGDGEARPGTDLTFFDFQIPRERRGTRSITSTGLRVDSEETLGWWRDRLSNRDVTHGNITEIDGRPSLTVEDPEGQRLMLVATDSAEPAAPWERSSVPAEHQIRGLGPIILSVARLVSTERVLTELMNMRKSRTYQGANGLDFHVFEMGEGGAAAELHVVEEAGAPAAMQGAGGVHHVAFRTPDVETMHRWTQHLTEVGIRHSGEVERYYFRSLYFREPNGILFEIATDGPGFTADEPLESLGERLALPPFLEGRRAEIEAGLRPL